MTVPTYDEEVVNSYLLAVNKPSYVISPGDADYNIWLNYLEVQTVFDYNQFKDVNAGIAIIRIEYVAAKTCHPCECYPELLLQFAYGGDFFTQTIFNVGPNRGCSNECC